MTTVAISQSNYIPWRGYFDLIRQADHFVLYDSVQFTRRDWRNRNRIVTKTGPLWLTVPVVSRGRFDQAIDATEVATGDWAAKHMTSLKHTYGRTRLFSDDGELIERLYSRAAEKTLLSDINRIFIDALSRHIGIKTVFHDSREFDLEDDRNERLLGICKALGATRYLSGPAAKNYLDSSLFAAADIEVSWMDYPTYLPYVQAHGGYEQGTSILDTLAYLSPCDVFSLG